MLKEFEQKQEGGAHQPSENAVDSHRREPHKRSAQDPNGSAIISKKKKPTNADNETFDSQNRNESSIDELRVNDQNLALNPEEKKEK